MYLADMYCISWMYYKIELKLFEHPQKSNSSYLGNDSDWGSQPKKKRNINTSRKISLLGISNNNQIQIQIQLETKIQILWQKENQRGFLEGEEQK